MSEEVEKTIALEDRLVDFAVRAIGVVEATYGPRGKDFIHKMKIALKELRETHVWLKIIEHKPLFS